MESGQLKNHVLIIGEEEDFIRVLAVYLSDLGLHTSTRVGGRMPLRGLKRSLPEWFFSIRCLTLYRVRPSSSFSDRKEIQCLS